MLREIGKIAAGVTIGLLFVWFLKAIALDDLHDKWKHKGKKGEGDGEGE